MASIPVAPTAAGPQWFGHPRQLARLFSTELWERFGFYGMRALLVLYLTKHFVFGDEVGTGMYGAYMSMVYLTPFIGGLLADRVLGSKRAVKFGALVMAVGYFGLCFGGPTARPLATFDGIVHPVSIEQQGGTEARFLVDHGRRLQIRGNDDGTVSLLAPGAAVARTLPKGAFIASAQRSPLYLAVMLVALSAIVVGNGFFKPNISTMVGSLYAVGDRRRDAGFTIFYMGINLGSIGSQILCPVLAVVLGWWAGFGLAAIGMVIAWGLMQFDGGRLAGYGEPPVTRGGDKALLVYLGAIVAIVLPWLLFSNTLSAVPAAAGSGLAAYLVALPLLGKLLFVTFVLGIPAILVWSWRAGSRKEFEMMVAAMILIVFNVTFWTLFEQAGSSLTLFADRNTDLSIFGLFTITAGQTQFFNSGMIVVLAPIFAAMWAALARRNLEPGIPVKFAIALIGVGAGFLFLVWGTHFAGADYKVAIWWLAGLYLIHSMAELCISPVGLSMITKLSMARIVGMMMGMWFLSISVAEYVGGIVAQVASVATVGGEVTNLKVSLETYAGVFQTIGLVATVIGLVLLGGSFFLKRLMHGVD